MQSLSEGLGVNSSCPVRAGPRSQPVPWLTGRLTMHSLSPCLHPATLTTSQTDLPPECSTLSQGACAVLRWLGRTVGARHNSVLCSFKSLASSGNSQNHNLLWSSRSTVSCSTTHKVFTQPLLQQHKACPAINLDPSSDGELPGYPEAMGSTCTAVLHIHLKRTEQQQSLSGTEIPCSSA